MLWERSEGYTPRKLDQLLTPEDIERRDFYASIASYQTPFASIQRLLTVIINKRQYVI